MFSFFWQACEAELTRKRLSLHFVFTVFTTDNLSMGLFQKNPRSFTPFWSTDHSLFGLLYTSLRCIRAWENVWSARSNHLKNILWYVKHHFSIHNKKATDLWLRSYWVSISTPTQPEFSPLPPSPGVLPFSPTRNLPLKPRLASPLTCPRPTTAAAATADTGWK